jgi:abhydrolase domain-containing protein 17
VYLAVFYLIIKKWKSKLNFRGMILQSAFKSILKTRLKTTIKIPYDMFSNIDRISAIEIPIIIIHGTEDNVVPFEHGLNLVENLKVKHDNHLYINFAGHNNIIGVLSAETYIKKIQEILVYLTSYWKDDDGGKEDVKEWVVMRCLFNCNFDIVFFYGGN